MNKDIDEILEKMQDNVIDLKQVEWNQEEMDRVFARTMEKIEKEKMEDITQEKAKDKIKEKTKEKTEIDKNTNKFSKKIFKRMWVAAIAATLVTGTVAFAAVHWNDKFVRFFGLNGEDDTHQAASMEVNRSDTVNGITVTAKEVVGDDQGFYLLLQVKGSDGSASEFRDIKVSIPGTDTYQSSDLMCMGIDEGTDSYILNLSSPEKLIGKNISLKLTDYGYGQENKFVVVNRGTWKLNWKINYKVDTKKYTVNKNINIYGGTAKFKNVVLSPLSVSVNLSNLKESEETIKNGEDPNDKLIVNFMDGSALNSYYEENVVNDTDKITIYLNRVVKPEEIENVVFAGVTVPITTNPNSVKLVHYDYKDLGFSIDLQKELDEITKTKQEEYYDTDVKAKGKKVTFTGTIDGASMELFDIIMLKTDISQDELSKRNPLMTYLGSKNGYVYTIFYGEPETEKQLNKFKDILNNDVANIKPRISINEIQN